MTRAVAIAAALLVLGVSASAADAAINTCSGSGATFAGGSGTSASPYLVATAVQLGAIRNSTYRTCAFRQTADIALAGEWTPIGSASSVFTGTYDGDDHLISGLSITTGSSYLGLFGYSGGGAIIENLRLSGAISVAGGSGIGALVGLADRPTTITNVHSTVSVSAEQRVGGLVGWLAEAIVRRSSASAAVTATKGDVGGIVGYARSSYGGLSSEITDSYATGAVTGAAGYEGVGGLVGRAEIGASPYSLVIARSYAVGSISGGTGTRLDCYPGFMGPPMCFPGSGTTGGIIAPYSLGSPVTGLTVTNGFWDTQTTGRATTADNKGTGATTAQLQTYATFASAGWDIANGWSASAVWGICDGSTYPFLSAQHSSSPCPAPPAPSPSPSPSSDPLPAATETPSATGSTAAPTSTPAPTAKPDAAIEVSTPIDGDARATVRWSADEDTAPTTLTTILPPGVAFQRTRAGCATAQGRVVSIAVPALRAGERGSCSFAVTVTRRTVSLTLAGGATRTASRAVQATASAAAWVRAALAVLDRGTPRATLNRALDDVRAGRTSRESAAAVTRNEVLAVREAQLAALAMMDRAPATLAGAELLLRRSLVLSADADRAYIAWLEGDTGALARAITRSILASSAKTRLVAALQGHGVVTPPATLLWP